MPPIYLGDTPVQVYLGETKIQSLAIGETIVNVYTTTTATP